MEGLIFGILRYRTCSLCLRVALPRRGRSFCCRRLLHTNISQPVYQKCSPSPHFTPRFTWNSLNISRMSRGFFLRPATIFHESYSKVKMIITRKIARKLTRTSKEKSRFLWHFKSIVHRPMHKPSNISSSSLCYKKASKECWENEKHYRFQPRLRIFLTRQAVTSRYGFAPFKSEKDPRLTPDRCSCRWMHGKKQLSGVLRGRIKKFCHLHCVTYTSHASPSISRITATLPQK